MSEIPELFVDGAMRVAIVGGVVRIDLGVFDGEGPRAEQTGGNLKPRQRLLIPLPGFLRTFETLEGLVRKMEADGLVRKGKGGQQDAVVETPSSG